MCWCLPDEKEWGRGLNGGFYVVLRSYSYIATPIPFFSSGLFFQLDDNDRTINLTRLITNRPEGATSTKHGRQRPGGKTTIIQSNLVIQFSIGSFTCRRIAGDVCSPNYERYAKSDSAIAKGALENGLGRFFSRARPTVAEIFGTFLEISIAGNLNFLQSFQTLQTLAEVDGNCRANFWNIWRKCPRI